jgi:NADPH2:quinone reductase
MRALVTSGNPATALEMREVSDPAPAANESLVEIKAVSINRGELRLLAARPNGWQPGQDIAGVVVRATWKGKPSF